MQKIIKQINDVNLKKITHNENTLLREKRKHGIKHGESVLYVNRQKNRFRLITNFDGIMVLNLPPIRKYKPGALATQVYQVLKQHQVSNIKKKRAPQPEYYQNYYL